MLEYGQIIEGKIYDQNKDYYFVQAEGQSFALEKSQVEGENLEKGSLVEGMIYEDMDRRLMIQADLPDIRPGIFGWAKVKQIRRELGVFVDVGLVNKDVVISLDDLPDNRRQWPKVDDQVYVTFECDKKQRLWAKLATIEQMQALFNKAPKRLMNQDVEVRIIQLKLAGAQCITKEGYRAFVHESEWILEPHLGECAKGRVTHVHRDGSLNVSLKPRAYEAIDDDAKLLLRLLEKDPEGFLPLHDKSDPEVIKAYLAISKGQFKRAVGALLKANKIRQVKGEGIYLLTDSIGDEAGE